MALSSTFALGRASVLQVLPPSVVASTSVLSTLFNPVAQQSEVVGHEMLVTSWADTGRASVLQVLPPSVVATTSALPTAVRPTAQQSVVVGHDTDERGPTTG